jgi:hypothetical protein
MRFTNFQRVQRLLAGAATVVTLSLAVTVKSERSCSPGTVPRSIPAAYYPYPLIPRFATLIRNCNRTSREPIAAKLKADSLTTSGRYCLRSEHWQPPVASRH